MSLQGAEHITNKREERNSLSMRVMLIITHNGDSYSVNDEDDGKDEDSNT